MTSSFSRIALWVSKVTRPGERHIDRKKRTSLVASEFIRVTYSSHLPYASFRASDAVKLRSGTKSYASQFCSYAFAIFHINRIRGTRDRVAPSMDDALQRDREAESFATVYSLTRATLLNRILSVNADGDEAEELLQETYLKAWIHRDQYDPTRGSVEAWLGTMGHNAAVDSVKRRALRYRNAAATHDLAGFADESLEEPADNGPLESAARQSISKALSGCLRSLPAGRREVVVLSFYEDLSLSEISAKMGQPLGTVKTWARRAVKSMRPRLELHR